MNFLLQLPLNTHEENQLIKFLRSVFVEYPSALDVLMMFYFQRNRYMEGFEVYEQINRKQLPDNNNSNDIDTTKRSVRDSIVRNYKLALPMDLLRRVSSSSLSSSMVSPSPSPSPSPSSSISSAASPATTRATSFLSPMNLTTPSGIYTIFYLSFYLSIPPLTRFFPIVVI